MIFYIKSLAQNRILMFVTIVALFIGRKMNLSFLLSGIRSNNYLDVVIDLRFILLFVVSVMIGAFLVSTSWKKGGLVLGYLAVWEIILIGRGFDQWFHGIERLIYGFLLLVFGWVFWNELILEKRLRLVLLCGFIPFLMFDHFFITESTGIFSLWLILGLVANRGKVKTVLQTAIFAFLSLHLISIIFGILKGSSLGFNIFGESMIDISISGLATWEVFGQAILRGYGLFAHPNITGYVGWVCLVVGFMKMCHSPWIGRVLYTVGIVQVILSGSRMAVLAMIIVGIGVITRSFQKRLVWFSSIGFVGIFGIYALIKGFSSDIYRFSDLEKWFFLLQSLQRQEVFFGIGLGQYPFYLRDSFLFLEVWEQEPVHNVLLLLYAELGLWIIGLVILLIFLKRKKLFTSE
jgi:hypothetical protein